MQRISSIDIGWGNKIRSISADNNYLYVGVGHSSQDPRMYRIQLSDFSVYGNYLDLGSENPDMETTHYSIIVDGFLYVAASGGTVESDRVIKINLSVWSIVGSVKSYAQPKGLAYDGSQYLYVVMPNDIEKIDLSTFSIVDRLHWFGARWTAIEIEGSFAYAVREKTPCEISKINLSTFTVEQNYILPASCDKYGAFAGYGFTHDSNYFYISHLNNKRISRTDIALTSTSYIDHSGLNVFIYSLCKFGIFDGYLEGDRLFIGDWSSPAKIGDITKSTFTEISAITLDSSENYANCMIVAGPTGGKFYLYVGHEFNPLLTKIDTEYMPADSYDLTTITTGFSCCDDVVMK